MDRKICFKCKIEKPLNEFYRHSGMGDGRLNKCKDCTKKDAKKRTDILKNDSEWIEKERMRGREKYKRLQYNKKYPNTNKGKYKITKTHRMKFPEKYKAKNASQTIKCSDGFHRHHWSYNKEHYKDVVILSIREHNQLHRFLIYDQERMMYRTTDNILLDTKERHLEYFESKKQYFDKF